MNIFYKYETFYKMAEGNIYSKKTGWNYIIDFRWSQHPFQ